MPLVAQRGGSEPLIGALAGGFVSAFFSFGGWWDLSKLAGEVRDPAHVLPRALLAGVSLITAVYVLTSAVFIYLVPLGQVTSFGCDCWKLAASVKNSLRALRRRLQTVLRGIP